MAVEVDHLNDLATTWGRASYRLRQSTDHGANGLNPVIMCGVVKPSPAPLSYLYLDEPGIGSLYAQTVDRLEIERLTTIEKAMTGKAGATARLKSVLLKALGGPELDISGELSGSRKRTEQSKHARTVEHKLASLIEVLQRIGEPVFFSDLGEAARRLERAGTRAYIRVEETFNAPQFFVGDGTTSVNESGYLILEKGGSDDYDDNDGYFRKPMRPITLSAGVGRMLTACGRIGNTGHVAMLFRGYSGRRIPLGVFGITSATPQYFQIKPYAIWR